jgi:hypothetical protein
MRSAARAPRRRAALAGAWLACAAGFASARPASADLEAAKKVFADGSKSGEWKTRRSAYLALTDHDSPVSVRMVLGGLATEPNLAVAAAAVDGLSNFRGDESRGALLDAAKKAKGAERLYAIVALEKQRAPEVDAFLLEALAAGPPLVAAQAALSLGSPGRAGAAPALGKALAHDVPQVRIAAARALATLGDAAAVKPLADRLKLEKGRVREEVVRALETLTKKKLGDAPLKWAAAAAGDDPDQVEEKPALPPTFFGIPVTGERVAFVLDRSLLMADPHPFNGAEHRARLESLCTPPDGERIPFRLIKSKMQLAVAHVLHAVEGFPPGTKYEVITFAADVHGVFGKKWANASAATRKTLDVALQGLEVDDGIAIWDALAAAFDLGGPGDERGWKAGPDVVLLVTNNIPTKGEVTDPDAVAAGTALRARLRLVPVHVVGIGNHPFTLADALARRSGGTYVNLSK